MAGNLRIHSIIEVFRASARVEGKAFIAIYSEKRFREREEGKFSDFPSPLLSGIRGRRKKPHEI
jgi:hypothetical protein